MLAVKLDVTAMQQDQQAFGDVQFLTGSPQRRSVLVALCDEPARPHELCEKIDATRTTIQRILAGFRERQWVVKRDGNYRATVTGQRVCKAYESLLDELKRARDFGPLASYLGPIADDLPVDALESGTLTVSEEGSPLAALSRFTEWLQGVQGEMYAVSPVVAKPFNEIGSELLDSGTPIEFVIDRAVLEQSKQHYESELELGANHDQMDIYVHEEPLSVGLALDSERACLVAYDDNNNIRALLETTDGSLYHWIEASYEHYQERSVSLNSLYEEGDDASTAEGPER